MESISDYLNRAADRCGFVRERYTERNLPTTHDNLSIMLFFGDMRSQFILSSLLLHRYKKEEHSSKYFILAGHAGHEGIYPYVDEYWGVRDSIGEGLGFNNSKAISYEQQVNRFFSNVFSINDMKKYYQHGLTTQFFEKYKWVVYNLPSAPSPKVEFNRMLAKKAGYKVFIHPSKTIKTWLNGNEQITACDISFWNDLVKELLAKEYTPVLWRNDSSYDLSIFGDKCLYCTERNMTDVLGIMRATGCVLDVFNDSARFATMARTPFITCAERHRYNELKEYELDGLCCQGLPYRYIFSFPTILESKETLIKLILNKLDEFLPTLDRDKWPTTVASSITVPYTVVRKKKKSRMGVRFLKVQKL